MNEKNMNEMEIKLCPVCSQNLLNSTGGYWCFNCEKWFEDIDFLDSEVKIDEDCKKCKWLVETAFKRDDLTVFYCNNMKTDRRMEKTRDFRKCDEFKEI